METLEFIFENEKKVKLPPPTVGAYYKIYCYAQPYEKTEGLAEWLASGSVQARAYIEPMDIIKAEIALSEWLRRLRQFPQYKPPHVPGDKDDSQYKTDFHELKAVSDYTGMNFKELRELDLLNFWRYYRDAIIYQLKKSDAGQDYLKQAYNSEQTKPDRAGLAQYIESQK